MNHIDHMQEKMDETTNKTKSIWIVPVLEILNGRNTFVGTPPYQPEEEDFDGEPS